MIKQYPISEQIICKKCRKKEGFIHAALFQFAFIRSSSLICLSGVDKILYLIIMIWFRMLPDRICNQNWWTCL